jgi:hypothetical protein
MKLFKSIIYVLSFLVISLGLGIGFTYFVGQQLPERASLISSKSFDADQGLIWAALLDIESYPLWKPELKRIEMLGTNEKGFTKWREFYSFGKQVTYQITDYIPKSLLEIKIIEANHSSEGIWIYKLSNYQDRGVLQIKRFAIVQSYFERFIRRWIDTKYSETDYQLMSLNMYLNQLLEDQDEMIDLNETEEEVYPDLVENVEDPLE